MADEYSEIYNFLNQHQHQNLESFPENAEAEAKPKKMKRVNNSSSSLPENKKTKIYPCLYCSRKFSSSQGLGGHQKTHKKERAAAWTTISSTGITTQPEFMEHPTDGTSATAAYWFQQPPSFSVMPVYSCLYCSRKFSTSKGLSGHKKAHKREIAAAWTTNSSTGITTQPEFMKYPTDDGTPATTAYWFQPPLLQSFSVMPVYSSADNGLGNVVFNNGGGSGGAPVAQMVSPPSSGYQGEDVDLKLRLG